MKNENSCPICESENTRFLFEGWDYLYGYPRSGKVRTCRDCRHVFVKGTMTEAEITDMYTNYYPRSQFCLEDYQAYQEKKGFFYWLDGESGFAFRHVPPNVRVLDVGCGYCETLGYHKSRGCEVWGVESDENVRKIAEKYGFNVKIGVFDESDYEPEYFDYVTMHMVFEHVNDPLETLKGIARILKSPSDKDLGGKVVIVVPNPSSFGRAFFGKLWSGWHIPFHRHLYSKKSIEILAEQAGLTVDVFRTETQSFTLLFDWACYLYANKKGQKASIDALASWGKFSEKDRKRGIVALYNFLKKYRILSPFMRLADGLGVGDWNLIILRKK